MLGGGNREIDAAILSVAHTFTVQNCEHGLGPRGPDRFGSIAQKFRGPIGQSGGPTGYSKNYAYDPLLVSVSPPKFLAPSATSFILIRYASVAARLRLDRSGAVTLVLILALGGFGLVIGSFLNVVAYRVPIGMSIVSPPSACPGAVRRSPRGTTCRCCPGRCSAAPAGTAGCRSRPGTRSSRRSPASRSGSRRSRSCRGSRPRGSPRLGIAAGLELIAYLYLAAISVALAVIDLDVRRLPDSIVLPSYAVAAVLLGGADVLRADLGALLLVVIGGAGSFLFYYALRLAKPGGMGFGDVKLAGVLGMFLGQAGLAQLMVGSFASFVLGGVAGIALIVAGRSTRKSSIPFGPWMLGGAWIGILAGAPLATAYLQLIGIE